MTWAHFSERPRKAMKRRIQTRLPATLPSWLRWSAWEAVRRKLDVTDRAMFEHKPKHENRESIRRKEESDVGAK